LIGNTVFAFYADESSAVNLGMVQSYSRSAINVIDDDGTAYTFRWAARGNIRLHPVRAGPYGSQRLSGLRFGCSNIRQSSMRQK
jgi:hypothetical protein